jgi:hypothetical protein
MATFKLVLALCTCALTDALPTGEIHGRLKSVLLADDDIGVLGGDDSIHSGMGMSVVQVLVAPQTLINVPSLRVPYVPRSSADPLCNTCLPSHMLPTSPRGAGLSGDREGTGNASGRLCGRSRLRSL